MLARTAFILTSRIARTITASLVKPAAGYVAPIIAAVAMFIAFLVAITRAFALTGNRTFIRTIIGVPLARTVVAGFIRSAASHITPFQTRIGIIVTALMITTAAATFTLAGDRTLVRTGVERNTGSIVTPLI